MHLDFPKLFGEEKMRHGQFANLKLLVAGSLCAAMAACAETSDPASETPVDLEPGNYNVTISGKGIFKNAGSGKKPGTICVTRSDRDSFPHKLAENYYKLHPACQVSRGSREGNAISGEIKCPVDPKMATGSSRFVYNGAVSSDNVEVEIRMKLDAKLKEGAGGEEVSDAQLKFAMKTFESMRFVIHATRIGECG